VKRISLVFPSLSVSVRVDLTRYFSFHFRFSKFPTFLVSETLCLGNYIASRCFSLFILRSLSSFRCRLLSLKEGKLAIHVIEQIVYSRKVRVGSFCLNKYGHTSFFYDIIMIYHVVSIVSKYYTFLIWCEI
jgi:hypothetical protein